MKPVATHRTATALSARFALLLLLGVAVALPVPAQEKSETGEAESAGAASDGGGNPAVGATDGTHDLWRASFDNALARAQSEGKALVLLITAPGWCGPCDRFEQTALGDTGVIDILREDFVAVRLTDRNPEHARFSFPGYPSLLVFHPTGRRLAASRGPQTAGEVREFLEPYRGPLDERLAESEAEGRITYRYDGGAFVRTGPEAERWLQEADGGRSVFTQYREDDRYAYLSAEDRREFVAIPTDGGQAFRWDPESESWTGAWEVSAPQPGE